MAKTVALTGNVACAQAMRQADPDVVAAYPITPQTTIVEEFSTYVADGLVNTEYVTVESEHSAMSASIGASAAGSRVMTATASQGLALMWEELYIASAYRLPIIMHNVNRTLSGPINIHCDHQDSMGPGIQVGSNCSARTLRRPTIRPCKRSASPKIIGSSCPSWSA